MFIRIQEHNEEWDLGILTHCQNYAFLGKLFVLSLDCTGDIQNEDIHN